MNNATRMAPSFLSYLSWVLPNIKKSIVTPSINAMSIIMFGLIAIGLIALLAPSTKRILKMFEPMTLPMMPHSKAIFCPSRVLNPLIHPRFMRLKKRAAPLSFPSVISATKPGHRLPMTVIPPPSPINI